MTMAVDRLLPSQDAEDLIALTRDIADKVLDPIVDAHEKAETYPEGVFAQLGAAGLLSLPQPEEWGGGGQPYEVYLQVLEEIAARWAAVAVAVSVHSLSSHPLLAFGTDEQKRRWLTYLDAARRRDLGRPYSQQASVAKLVATDAAMKVTTDAVQVFGGVGYTRHYRVERYMREAKITQIFEGTNQIQRLVIARGLTT
jgi:alkylation response protein AidB-like acyl-CoA dehydrogenase